MYERAVAEPLLNIYVKSYVPCRVITIGTLFRVAIRDEICEAFDALPVEKRAGLRATMETFAGLPRGQTLPKQLYETEGRVRVKGKDIALFAFKDSHYRIYGGFGTVDGVATWLGVILAEKKRQRAKRRVLEAAAQLLREYV